MQRATVPKDPQKVAAGRAGAAARQAKQDKLKAELRDATLQKLTGPSDSQIDLPKSELPEQHPPRNTTDWIPRIIGGVGLAVAVLFYVKPWGSRGKQGGSRGKQAPPDKGGLKEEPQPSSPQLKNPHYMA